MRGSTRIIWGTVGVLALYVVVVVTSTLRTSTETFPFFSWDLFSRVPLAEEQSWSIRLVEVDGQRLAQPVYFDEAGDHISTFQSPDAERLMQRLGRSVEVSDAQGADRARAILEARFLQELDTATYQLVRRRYDVLDRFECDCFLEEVVIEEYTLP